MRERAASSKLEISARLFSALGDKTRLQMVTRLCDQGPLSITRLSEGAQVTRQAISKHLRVMEDAGLVKASRSGREQIYELETKRMEIAHAYLEHMSKRWDHALDRLKELVEDEIS